MRSIWKSEKQFIFLVYTDRENRAKKGEGKSYTQREKIILFKLVIFQILPSSPLYMRRSSHSRNRKHLRPEVSRTIET